MTRCGWKNWVWCGELCQRDGHACMHACILSAALLRAVAQLTAACVDSLALFEAASGSALQAPAFRLRLLSRDRAAVAWFALRAVQMDVAVAHSQRRHVVARRLSSIVTTRKKRAS